MPVYFAGWVVPPQFWSDGCTFPGPLALLKWPMRSEKYKPACVMHDFLRRHICHYGMKPSEADAIFRRHLKALGASSFLATLYWGAVKLMRPWFTQTHPLPLKWQDYRFPRTTL